LIKTKSFERNVLKTTTAMQHMLTYLCKYIAGITRNVFLSKKDVEFNIIVFKIKLFKKKAVSERMLKTKS